jgi:hypothetical protein
VALFGFGYFMMAFAYNSLWAYACDHDLLERNGDKEFFRSIRMTYRCATIYNFIAFFVCFASIPAAIGLYLMMFSVFAFPKEFAIRLSRIGAARSEERSSAR